MDSTRTTTYTYDAWARLKQASNSQWTITETYDRYGNRKSQSAPVANNVTVNASTNRLTDPGYSYDAAGNMTSDGLNALTYDAENRVVTNVQAGATTNYILDGSNLRVKKCLPNCTSPTSRTVYIFSGTKVIAEYDNGAAVASPSREYIYSGSTLLAKIEGGAATYHHQDHLSNRVLTDSSGAVIGQQGHFPFGESWYAQSGSTKWQFTSYERDSESGNDYAMMRSYVNRLARFSSPDPVAGSLADPQSLNRYAYTVGDPINLLDPLGLYVNCLLDGQEVPCFVLSSLFRSMEFVDIARSFLGPNWVPSGGEYRNRGCYTNRVTDAVWCPGAAVSLFNMGDLSFLDDFLIDVPIDPCETRGGRRFGPGHRANDYHAPSYGTSVYTAGPGIVVGARSGSPHVSPPYDFSLRPPATNYVRVDLNSGYTVGYFHVTPSVAVGDTVPRGGILGTVDNSGRTTGPHVHVEVRNPLGNPVNPNSFFKDCN